MVTADAFLFPVNVDDKRGGVRIGVNDHEGANGFALQHIFPIVVGRVYVVDDLDVRIAGCDPVIEITFVTLMRVTQGLNDNRDLPAKACHKFEFAG